jgi:hypothetical protein
VLVKIIKTVCFLKWSPLKLLKYVHRAYLFRKMHFLSCKYLLLNYMGVRKQSTSIVRSDSRSLHRSPGMYSIANSVQNVYLICTYQSL